MRLRTLATAATLFLAPMPALAQHAGGAEPSGGVDRKSTRLNSSHG